MNEKPRISFETRGFGSESHPIISRIVRLDRKMPGVGLLVKLPFERSFEWLDYKNKPEPVKIEDKPEPPPPATYFGRKSFRVD